MGHPPSPCPLRAGARERGSVDTGASWAGYLVFPSISVPPTLTCIGVWVDHLGLPHGRIGVFHLEYFFRNEPCLPWEIWSDPIQTLLILCYSHLPPTSLTTLQSCWFLSISSLQAIALSKLCQEFSSSALPCMAHSHPSGFS